MDIDNPNDYTLDIFNTWTVPSLKTFLEKRGLSSKGTKPELISLCFAANKMNLPLKLSHSQTVMQNSEDYNKMLLLDSSRIPDPLKLNNGWYSEKDGVTKWPPVYLSDITTYFMKYCETVSSKYLNEYKIGKAYEYFTNDWLKEVFYHPIEKTSKLCLLRAACTPSQRISDTPHYVWACLGKTTGEIKSAYCTCAAGLGQTCNHVAGLIFRVENANKMGLVNPACTSLPCTWSIPSQKTRSGPKEISDMFVKKSQYGKPKKRPLVSQEKRQFAPLEPKSGSDLLHSLGQSLRDVIPNACIFKGLEMDNNETDTTTNTTTNDSIAEVTATDTHDAANFNIDKFKIHQRASKYHGQENVLEFIQSLPRPFDENVEQISEATKQQSESPLWHEMRKGRITASRFYAVHTKVNTIKKSVNPVNVNTTSLLQQLLGKSSFSDDPEKCPRAIKHGRAMEPVAKEQYQQGMKGRHLNFQAEECGLFIHQEYPYLGASPDMLVSCECCGQGVLEVKCPLVPPCSSCGSGFRRCTNKLRYLLYDETSRKYELKQNTAYYAQVQGQMALTRRSYCDFYIFTEHAKFSQRMMFNERYWSEILSSLIFFYETYMARFVLQDEENQALELTCQEEPMEIDEGNVSFCQVCYEVIKEQENIHIFQERSICCDQCSNWYHFKCVGMKKATLQGLEKWKCKFC